MSLFEKNHILLNSKATTQVEAFEEIAKLAESLNVVDKAADLVKGLQNREKESTTGFEDGFAIPHARIPEVKKPVVIFARYNSGIEWKSLDNSKVKVAIALIIPEGKSADIHLNVLSGIARKLIKKDVRELLKKSNDFKEIQNTLFEEVKETTASKTTGKNIVGITACPVGVAHTYLAADNLTAAGQELGYNIKIETHGSAGVQNNVSPKEVKEADVVIIAADIGVDASKFAGKRIYRTGVTKAIKDPKTLIATAFEKAIVEGVAEDSKSGGAGKDIFEVSGGKQGIMKHLMSGVSYMVPIVILGGIFIALSIGLSKAIYGPKFDPGKLSDKNVLYYLLKLGGSAFTLMIPILGAFIANSIAGRAAIAPALVVSYIGNDPSAFYPLPGIENVTTPTGFLGAIAAGLAVGYTVKWINTWKVPKGLRPVMPIFVIPILVGFVYSMIMMFVIGSCVGFVMGKFSDFIKDYWGNDTAASNIAVGLGFGLLIGAMAGFDMGGPVNKVAFLTCTGLVANGIYTPMGAMACAIPVAPLGMGIATWIFRPLFNKDQRVMGSTAFGMGCIGISEGAIPFAVNDPKRVIPANIVGSAVAGAIAGVVGIADVAGHGGPIVAFLGAIGTGNGDAVNPGWGSSAVGYTLLSLLIMLIGALITAFIYGFWLIIDKKRKGEDISLKQFVVKRHKGEGTLAAIKRHKKENNIKAQKNPKPKLKS